MTYDKAIQMVEKQGISIPERKLLRKVHSARNEAQHRGVVASESWTRFHIMDVSKFMRRYCAENFDLNLDELIQLTLRLVFYKKPKVDVDAKGVSQKEIGKGRNQSDK